MAGSKITELAIKMTTPNSTKPYKRKRDLDASQASTLTKGSILKISYKYYVLRYRIVIR